ncbi:MAG: DUF1573 domain-containing protein [Spartobacteria bacterium]|nr:DUF1573 domain-containing protein [Spartobacteria bacterium]
MKLKHCGRMAKKRLLTGLGVLCCVTGVSLATETEREDSMPFLVCQERTHNFGVVDNEHDVVHSFEVYNAGLEPLTLEIIRPDQISNCRCRPPTISFTNVMFGETVFVEMKLKTASIMGPSKRLITVKSNDPRTPVLALEGQADVHANFHLSPAQYDLGRISTHMTVSNWGLVTFIPDRIPRIKNIESSSDHIVPWYFRGAASNQFRILLTTHPPMPTGTLESVVTLTTVYEKKEEKLTIPVTAQVVHPIEVNPDSIAVDRSIAEHATYDFFVRSDFVNFVVTSVAPSSDTFKSEITGVGQNLYKVSVSNFNLTAGLTNDFVQVNTTLPQQPSIRVPVLWQDYGASSTQ